MASIPLKSPTQIERCSNSYINRALTDVAQEVVGLLQQAYPSQTGSIYCAETIALSHENQKPPNPEESSVSAEELIVQVDGSHIPTKDKGKRSFEALSAVIYRPSSLEFVDQHHSIINARHKRKQKMQWTREGAHNVLQIRASRVSQE